MDCTPDLNRIDCSLRRYYVDRFMFQCMERLSPGSTAIDIGGLRDKKRGEFDIRKFDISVITLNMDDQYGVDVIADATAMPFPDACFDVAICSELLEHVEEPRRVLQEASRVLRKDGVLIATAPFMYPIHADPHDFARYTSYYWERELARTGFLQVEVLSQGALWSVVVDSLRDAFCQSAQNSGSFPWPFHGVLHRALLWGKKRAIRWDQSARAKQRSHLTKYTTGFGIFARR